MSNLLCLVRPSLHKRHNNNIIDYVGNGNIDIKHVMLSLCQDIHTADIMTQCPSYVVNVN